MSETLSIGISTCPNDTFAFHALLEGEVEVPGHRLSFELADVEELNRAVLAGRLDVAKVSFHAALAAADDLVVLDAGSALGHGVGPVVLGSPGGRVRRERAGPPRVLAPGTWTTAHLLWRLFHPEPVRLEQRVFSEIVPALLRGEAELGVCIHEARFTWREAGLELVEDLGETWHAATRAALPLGGIVARRSLGEDVARRISDAIRRSIEWGFEHRTACLPTMRRHAQEQADDVLWGHVDLYVTDETRRLGPDGRRALSELAARAREAGPLGHGAAFRGELRVVEP